MHNQKAVFNLCPIVNQQFSTHMQQLEYDLNQDTIQATIDICLHLTYFRNLTQNKLGPVQIAISVVSQQLAIAIPYQIVSNKTYQTFSKIDLQTYSSSLYVLQPQERSIIDEMVIFKIHVPIDQVETGNLKVTVALQTVDEMSFDNNDTTKRLGEISFKFNSILYIDSFLPCLFDSYGISLQGNIYSHLLGCKYGNFNNIYRHHFYQAIDHLVICYNKLREKTSPSNRNCQIEENEKQFEDLPLYIDMKKYEEFDQIRSFIDKRIFQQQSMKEHRIVLQKFVQKFIPQMRQKLLMVWKLFLKMINFSLVQESRQDFYDKLGLELKKRVEYKVQTSSKSISEIQKKTNFVQINYPQYKQYNSSIIRSDQKDTYSFVENQIAQNALKQRFDDKKNYQMQKKLYISNLQFPYPSVKVRLNKTLKLHSKEQLETVVQPHIVVFVHGLGASSNSFTQFQTCLKNIYWKNLFVLNSHCNENSVDESIDQMGRKLSIEVTQFIIQNNFGENFQLSFIGHSLGGLIIRAALSRLECYKFNMKTLITLSTPHLGYFYHNSALNKAGMWAISKFSENQVINNLLMIDDNKDKMDQQSGYRNSYLYSLSLKQGVGWFENVMFCGSMDDYFVSPLSAFATTRESIQMKKDLKSKIWEQMRVNIESNFINCNIYRLLVEFGDKNQASIKDQLIGRASHVMYLSSKDFISYILLGFKDLFI